jgi:dTDP-D-glucose 4,6-dehydratase
MHAPYHPSLCNHCTSRGYLLINPNSNFFRTQLLKECGAISDSDAEKATSAVNYQDIATESLSSNNDNDDAAFKEDEAEDPQSPEHVDVSAVGRVCRCV